MNKKPIHLCYQKLGSHTKTPFEVVLEKEIPPARCVVSVNGERFTMIRAALSTNPVKN